MTVQRSKRQLIKLIAFVLLALPFGYLFITAQIEVALLALLCLSALFLLLRPFTVSTRAATALLVSYLAFSGLLNFSQPLMVDSWSVFATILLVSSMLQPVIFLLTLDAVMGLLNRTRRHYDAVVVVLLWASTLAVTFGSTSLLHTNVGDVSLIFLLLLVPWLVNGVVFFAAALVLLAILAKNKTLHRGKPKGKAKRAK